MSRGVMTRAPSRCACRSAVPGAADGSSGAGDEPPVIDPAAVPPDETGPDQPMEQRRVCAVPTAFPNSNFADKPWANDYLRVADAQKFATGAGVTVAVMDTGVNGSPAFPPNPVAISSTRPGTGCRTATHTAHSPRRHRRPARPDRRIHRGRAGRADPVTAADIGQLSAGRIAQRPQRPQLDPNGGVAAQPGPRNRARGQHRRAGHQYQRGRLLQGDPTNQ